MTTSSRRRSPKRAHWPQNPKPDEDAHGLGDPPWAKVQRVALIRREVREVLSPAAVAVLFDHVDIVVEGSEEVGGRRLGDRRFFATVMVTIDLARCAPYFREPADEATARRVAELMDGAPSVQQRLHTLAAREVAQLAGVEPHGLALAFETTLRVEDATVLVDIDVTATEAARRG